jgi:hypothetical protein
MVLEYIPFDLYDFMNEGPASLSKKRKINTEGADYTPRKLNEADIRLILK